MKRNRFLAAAFAALICCFLAASISTSASAKDFPPVTDAQRALTEVPGQPGAPAAVLEKIGRLDIMDYPTEVSSRLDVRVRLKILTEKGVDAHGEIAIAHSRFLRLRNLQGRTVSPDGSVIELPADSVFEENSSRSRRLKLTKAAFPAVEVGSIIDYSYSLMWDDPFFLEPWIFHEELPVMLSEITYVIPEDMRAKPWARQTTRQEFQIEQEQTPQGLAYRVRLENLAGMPDEPYSFPRIDLSSRFMIVPETVRVSGSLYQLLETWTSACELYQRSYSQFQRKNRQGKKKAKELIVGASSRTAKIAALHSFVRDEILTEDWIGVGYIDPDAGVDGVLNQGRGSGPEKALVLHSLLDAVKIDADLIWVADRREGVVDLELPNPSWFDGIIVRTIVDGESIFLDPSDRDLAMGQLNPYLEGTPALIFDDRRPETIELPTSAWDDNSRKARLRLQIDEDGRVVGDGSAIFTGHHAWRYIHLGDDEESAVEDWEEWLLRHWDGYDVGEIEIEEKLEERSVRVDFSLVQREEEVLGDEVSLFLSPPLGPVEQPFVLDQRLTPVRLPFPDVDEVVVDLVWPEDWEIDAFPESVVLENAVGSIEADLDFNVEERTLQYKRRFVLRETEVPVDANFRALRKLYDVVSRHDQQALVLILP